MNYIVIPLQKPDDMLILALFLPNKEIKQILNFLYFFPNAEK